MGEYEQKTAPDGYHYTLLAAPVFAGFSLPAIIIVALDKSLAASWRNTVLLLLAFATSLFMASIGLCADPIRKEWPSVSGHLRGFFSMLGICVAAGALFTIGLAVINQWWAPLVLSPLLIGSIVPAVISLVLWFAQRRERGLSTASGAVSLDVDHHR
jgi:hypothetical protein